MVNCFIVELLICLLLNKIRLTLATLGQIMRLTECELSLFVIARDNFFSKNPYKLL